MKTPTYGYHKLSFKQYITATVDERLMTAVTDEMHEQAVDILNMSPTVEGDNKAIDRFIAKTEKAMIDELIKQLKERKAEI